MAQNAGSAAVIDRGLPRGPYLRGGHRFVRMTTSESVEVCPLYASEVVRVRRADTARQGQGSDPDPPEMTLKLFWTCDNGHNWSEQIVSGESGSRR